MAHPPQTDEWVTSIEVDAVAFPGVEEREPVERPPQNDRCAKCGKFMGSEHPVHEKE